MSGIGTGVGAGSGVGFPEVDDDGGSGAGAGSTRSIEGVGRAEARATAEGGVVPAGEACAFGAGAGFFPHEQRSANGSKKSGRSSDGRDFIWGTIDSVGRPQSGRGLGNQLAKAAASEKSAQSPKRGFCFLKRRRGSAQAEARRGLTE
jgi:hypothetical protein